VLTIKRSSAPDWTPPVAPSKSGGRRVPTGSSTLGERRLDGDGEESVDAVGDEPARDEREEDERGRADETPAQLVQVLKERHVAGGLLEAARVAGVCDV
jgi:hypothetical protein